MEIIKVEKFESMTDSEDAEKKLWQDMTAALEEEEAAEVTE